MMKAARRALMVLLLFCGVTAASYTAMHFSHVLFPFSPRVP